jgi:branched-subunit amino acid aminotransferase/4-amino-4-deoxychorismate lyase
MSTQPVVYLRGRFVPAHEAHLSIYDSGIIQGATITDLLRTFRHQPFRLEEHVTRFFESCAYARILPPLTRDQTLAVTRELTARNAALLDPDGDLAVVFFITPGENLIYAGSAASGQKMEPTFCIHSFPLPFPIFRRFFSPGLHLVIPPTRHVPPQCVDPKAKNRSRLHWWLAEQEAHLVDPDASPLLMDLDGNLTETSGANFLLVKNGFVFSPTRRNILLGVSRAVVIEICERLGIPFQERDLQMRDALTADEAFIATTPCCIAPVTKISGTTIGNGTPGPIFERLLAAFSEEVGLDIRTQFMSA